MPVAVAIFKPLDVGGITWHFQSQNNNNKMKLVNLYSFWHRFQAQAPGLYTRNYILIRQNYEKIEK